MCGVIGRTLPPAQQHELLVAIGTVAPRYKPLDLPPESKQLRKHVRGRFLGGVSLTGRESRTLVGQLVSTMALPNPFHMLLLAFSHLVVLTYSSIEVSYRQWQGRGILCTYLVHLVMELAEEGSCATLYFHGWQHQWFQKRTPVGFSDEAGERDLRMNKRFAPVTSTQADASTRDILTHELWKKFVKEGKERKVPEGNPSHGHLCWRRVPSMPPVGGIRCSCVSRPCQWSVQQQQQ